MRFKIKIFSMKKLSSVVVATLSLLLSTQAIGQNANVTAATAAKNTSYTVLNKEGTVILYKYHHLAHSPKETEKYAPTYFFTTQSSDVLQSLTKDNLKKAFPENHPFHDALDATFDSDKDLIVYDSFHKMYKVSWLLKENNK